MKRFGELKDGPHDLLVTSVMSETADESLVYLERVHRLFFRDASEEQLVRKSSMDMQ
jgi:hypothetical protein